MVRFKCTVCSYKFKVKTKTLGTPLQHIAFRGGKTIKIYCVLNKKSPTRMEFPGLKPRCLSRKMSLVVRTKDRRLYLQVISTEVDSQFLVS